MAFEDPSKLKIDLVVEPESSNQELAEPLRLDRGELTLFPRRKNEVEPTLPILYNPCRWPTRFPQM